MVKRCLEDKNTENHFLPDISNASRMCSTPKPCNHLHLLFYQVLLPNANYKQGRINSKHRAEQLRVKNLLTRSLGNRTHNLPDSVTFTAQLPQPYTTDLGL
ncbi:hypothetical protein PGIGA_G00105890 [Pangasianodon gigas]|uniref:Uncharacterized protein n=1 Tax=Pangasianodon gigas TaxID=30993 RepID=A0ACC5W7S8_PANGG|nr:hypothetical protein [Pangasianodon gigas]